MPELVTVPNYPLVKVGTWSASTGKKSVTKEDLEAIVEAHDSKMLDKGVIKKGHLDPRHQNPAWDGEPVYGQVDNLRLSEDGLTLLGDYVNVPKELAESLPSAYPNRSVEIAWGVQLHDAAGKVSKKFKAALAGVALLGRTPPAVKGLGGPQVSALSGSVECDSVGLYATTDFALPGGLTANALRTALDKAIGDAYRKPSTAAGLDGDYPWMTDYDDTTAWFRLNAGTFQVTFTADATGTITLGDDVVEVVERRTFVPVSDTPTVPQTNLSETEANDVPGTPRANDTSNKEEPPMSEFLKKLRDKLGLPETATEEEILTAAAEAVPAPKAEEAPAGKEATPAVPAAGVTVETGTSASEGGKHAAPADGDAPKTVAVSAASFAELMERDTRNSARLADLEAKDKAAHVTALVTKFSAEGKIHPTEKDYFRAQLEANEAPTVTFLSERAGIPVSEIGSENADVAHFSDDAFSVAANFFDVNGGK